MNRCNECNQVFHDPKVVTDEVGDEQYYECPFCRSSDIEPIEDDEWIS